MDINLYLEDSDNPELCGSDWDERMREAVADYNNEYGTVYDVSNAVQRYKSWKHDKHKMEV